MVSENLIDLLDGFDSVQVDIIEGIDERMNTAKADRWTGKINFELNMSQGQCGDMHINKGEVLRVSKRRKIRSRGI